MERESPFSVSLEVKMAAKLVNLGFGFGPPRNPRSGPPWVSRAERRARGRESKGGEARRGEKGGEAATASAAAVELLTSIHHCVTKNELERERERERKGRRLPRTYRMSISPYVVARNRTPRSNGAEPR